MQGIPFLLQQRSPLAQITMHLIHINDVQHICAAVSELLADESGATCVVFHRMSHQPDSFDVWISRPEQAAEQIVWHQHAESLNALLEMDGTFSLTHTAVGISPLRDLANEHLVGIPLRSAVIDEQPVGAICLLDSTDEQIESLLPLIADHTMSYIERATLHQTITRQRILFEVVNDITVSLTSTLSLGEIYDCVANPVRRILNVESVSIGLVSETKNELVFVPELLGHLLHSLRVSFGQGIAGWVAQHNETVMTNDPYADKRFYRDVDQATGYETRSVLAVPLRHDGHVVGVLEALNKESGDFSDFDRSLMEAISSPLAIALENANLHSDVLAEKRRIETIFASMSEGLLTFDPAGAVTGINDSLLSMLQITEHSDEAQSVFDLIRTADGTDIPQFILNVLGASDESDSPHVACDLRVPYADQNIPVLISGSTIRDENKQVVEAVLVFSDLKQIREVERMRDDFFSNIVHELRTPLATILMYARLLRASLKHGETEVNARSLQTIEMESDRLQAMVRSMLALARLEAKEIQRSDQPLNLNCLFDTIIPPLSQRALEEGITLDTEIAPDLPMFNGDHDVLYSVFKNLIENAVKFTLQGSVSVAARAADQMILIDIVDTGIGIPDEAMPSLFKRFFRSRTAVEHGIAGTGLGLYMVKEGIERHRGTITVESVIGQGTSFYICLPVQN